MPEIHLLTSKADVPVSLLPLLDPQLIENGAQQRQHEQDDEKHQDLRVGLFVDRGAFQWSWEANIKINFSDVILRVHVIHVLADNRLVLCGGKRHHC